MTWQKIHPPVVRSLLENDLYKFTMWQALLHRFPQTQAEYSLPLPARQPDAAGGAACRGRA
jgi:nicotinic acid phosphoribosyltransferase